MLVMRIVWKFLLLNDLGGDLRPKRTVQKTKGMHTNPLRPPYTFYRYCQLNENSTLSTQFASRESIDLSGIRVVAPRLDGAQFGLS